MITMITSLVSLHSYIVVRPFVSDDDHNFFDDDDDVMFGLVDPVGEEVANQSNAGLQHSSTLGAWVRRAG